MKNDQLFSQVENYFARLYQFKPSLLGRGGTATVYEVEPDVVVKASFLNSNDRLPYPRKKTLSKVKLRINPRHPEKNELLLEDLLIPISRETASSICCSLTEASILKSTNDVPYLVRYLDQYFLESNGYLVSILMVSKVDGNTLPSSETQLPIQDCAKAVADVSYSLGILHDRGIVHRDIKPKNIIYLNRSRCGDGDTTLIDFGSAQLVGSPFSYEQVVASCLGICFSTEGFSSPELERGESPTFSDDTFSLGVTSYYLLTGTVPFTIEQIREYSPSTVEKARRDISRINLSPHLVTALMKTLAVNP